MKWTFINALLGLVIIPTMLMIVLTVASMVTWIIITVNAYKLWKVLK